MKLILGNIVIIILLALAYFFDVFSLFTGRYMFFISLIIILILFIAAFKLIGSPFADKNSKEK